MSRWYKVQLGDLTWDATGDPSALNCEMDIPVTYLGGPDASGAFVRIWGIPLQLIQTAKQYNSKQVTVSGGMQKGLPLANPSQQGVLVQGNAFPVIGNWVNTDMYLDIYIKGPFGFPTVPGAANVIHHWPKGQPLSSAIKTTIQTAFPGYAPLVNISSKLILPYVDAGYYETVGQWASYITDISKSIMNDAKYLGVRMFTQGNQIVVNDGTTPSGQKQIAFTDLIGQPIWTGPQSVQFKTVMRGDIHILDTVTLPKSLATLTSGAATQSGVGNASNVIQGSFSIQRMRHTGNFRQPDWASWCTTFDANVA